MMENKPIFDCSSFILCSVPVPKRYPQSQTHSGIAIYKDDYYLVTTPYPNRKLTKWQVRTKIALRKLTLGLIHRLEDGEYYENPCLYRGIADDYLQPPIIFEPIADNPLISTPQHFNQLPSYNSDPDIFIEDGHFYILNRTVRRTKITKFAYESRITISLIEGECQNGCFKQIGINSIKEWDKPYVSPCLTKYDGKYVFTYLDTNSAIDSSTFNGLFLQQLDSLDALANNENYIEVKVTTGEMLPWHMSLFQYNGVMYSIVACVKKGDKTRKIWQMFGQFNQALTELTIYPTPLTDFNSYRGAACVRKDGMFILYSTTLWEKIKGSKSVDGRDVIVAQMPFVDLLKQVNC